MDTLMIMVTVAMTSLDPHRLRIYSVTMETAHDCIITRDYRVRHV